MWFNNTYIIPNGTFYINGERITERSEVFNFSGEPVEIQGTPFTFAGTRW